MATIHVGDDGASAVYVAAKHNACAEAGITSYHHELPSHMRLPTLLALVDELNADPHHLDAATVIERVAPDKDADGLTIANAGQLALGLDGLLPCTPAGVMELLRELRGARAVVITGADPEAVRTTLHELLSDGLVVAREGGGRPRQPTIKEA